MLKHYHVADLVTDPFRIVPLPTDQEVVLLTKSGREA